MVLWKHGSFITWYSISTLVEVCYKIFVIKKNIGSFMMGFTIKWLVHWPFALVLCSSSTYEFWYMYISCTSFLPLGWIFKSLIMLSFKKFSHFDCEWFSCIQVHKYIRLIVVFIISKKKHNYFGIEFWSLIEIQYLGICDAPKSLYMYNEQNPSTSHFLGCFWRNDIHKTFITNINCIWH